MTATLLPPQRTWTVEEYDRLVELGMFEGERVELIECQIVTVSPMGAPRIGAINRLTMILAPALAGRAVVQVQGPVALKTSRPEPDLAVLSPSEGPDALAETGHLVIEVAEASLAYDRDIKMPLYGAAGFTEGWVVNLADGELEVYREPTSAGFRTRRLVYRGESVRLADFADVEVALDEILG